jgi:integrase
MATRIPSLRHHKPSKQAVVTLNGRDHYCGPWGSKQAKAEYQRLAGEWLASGGTLRVTDRDAITVAELVLAYRKFASTYYAAPSTEGTQIRLAMRPVAERYGHTFARDFGPLSLKAIREVWIEAGLARKYINQRVGRIVRAWGWAVENELVPAECLQALKAVKGLRAGRSDAKETPAVRPVSDSIFETTLVEIGSPQVRAMLQVMRLTGARPGEVCIMRTADIDRSASPWEYRPRTHKTAHRGHERVIYIGPKAQGVLADWLRADPEAFLFQPREAAAAVREAARSPGGRMQTGRARPGAIPWQVYPGDRDWFHSWGQVKWNHTGRQSSTDHDDSAYTPRHRPAECRLRNAGMGRHLVAAVPVPQPACFADGVAFGFLEPVFADPSPEGDESPLLGRQIMDSRSSSRCRSGLTLW